MEHYLPNMCPHTFCVGPQRIEKFHVKSLKHFLGARDPTQGLEDQRIFSCYLKQKRNFYQLLSVSICADLKGQTHSYVVALSMQLSQLCTIRADSIILSSFGFPLQYIIRHTCNMFPGLSVCIHNTTTTLVHRSSLGTRLWICTLPWTIGHTSLHCTLNCTVLIYHSCISVSRNSWRSSGPWILRSLGVTPCNMCINWDEVWPSAYEQPQNEVSCKYELVDAISK